MRDRLSIPAALSVALTLLVAIACGSPEQSAPATRPETAAAKPAPAPAQVAVDYSAEAKELFELRCTACHGARGAGDGPGSAALSPQPRNFQDPEWQAAITDEQISQAVLYGGAAVGKSPAMPSNPDLGSKEPLVAALVQHIRSLQR